MPDHLVANGAEHPAPGPIDQALPQFFAKLDQWQKEFGSPMLIGLSGGGDSMALCRMASHWAKVTGATLHAASIGHERLAFQERSFGWMSGPRTVGCRLGPDKRAIRH
jgi:hypothetical protein